MIDTLLKQQPRFQKPQGELFDALEKNGYFVLTLHRPANVDEEVKLKATMEAILAGTGECPVLFPVHPRTAKILKNLGIKHPRLHYLEPLSYLSFNFLVQHAKGVITDSGGITEEASVMNVPCLTLRDNTERPETIHQGTNELVGTSPERLKPFLERILAGNWKQYQGISLWDGHAAERIIKVLYEIYGKVSR